VQPKAGLDEGTHTATVTVYNTANSISASFTVKFEVGLWVGSGWTSTYPLWPDDALASGVIDPVPPPTYPTPTNTGHVSGDVTITFESNGTQYTVAGVDGLSGPYGLADVGITFDSGFPSDKRITLNGTKVDSTIQPNPVTITLGGVTINAVAGASPITLQNGANVILVLAGTNTLTAATANYAGLQVPVNNAITIIGSGALNVTSTSNGAGIGGSNLTGFLAGGTISIGGNARVTAIGSIYTGVIGYSGYSGAGIGGAGSNGAGGTISIGGSAQVTATSGGNGAGIGGSGSFSWDGGDSNVGGEGGTITLGGSAQVTATSDRGAAGIGGGNQGAGGTIEITGNARVYAKGGVNGPGIGGGKHATPSSTSMNITIGTGTDYPVVFAYGSADATFGYGAGIGQSSRTDISAPFAVVIKSGFVAARAAVSTVDDIGNGNTTVTITGGSVYPYNGKVAAPTNGDGTLVYPLYVPASLGGHKTISVPTAYATKTIGKTVARFISTGLWTPAGADQFPATAITTANRALFPNALSATLWLPEGTYTGITVGGAGNYTGNVTPAVVAYTSGGVNRLQ
jgi:hypothetical protein